MTTATEHLAHDQRKYPPHVPPAGGVDRAQQLYNELAPSLPDELQGLISTGNVAIGEIGRNQPIAQTVMDGAVVEFYSGMFEFVFAVVRTLAGMNARVVPNQRAGSPVRTLVSTAEGAVRLFKEWKWPDRWLLTFHEFKARPFRLSSGDEDWTEKTARAADRFLLAHELGHVLIAHGLAVPFFTGFENEELEADAFAGELQIRLSEREVDDITRLFGGSVLALRIFAALKHVGVPFDRQYPDQELRMNTFWSFMRSRISSEQYFHEMSRIAVAYLEQMDDVVAILENRPAMDTPNEERFLVTLIAKLLELSRRAISGKEMVDYIVRRSNSMPESMVQDTLRKLRSYYSGSSVTASFFDTWTVQAMGHYLGTVINSLPNEIRRLL